MTGEQRWSADKEVGSGARQAGFGDESAGSERSLRFGKENSHVKTTQGTRVSLVRGDVVGGGCRNNRLRTGPADERRAIHRVATALRGEGAGT